MKNYYGDEVMEKRFRNPSFGYIDSHGNAHVNWASENDDVDNDGFDKHHEEVAGGYKQEILLPYGTLICRYGNVRGRLTTDIGSDYDKLSIPYVMESVEYHVYKVIADGVQKKCMVQRGKVAPMFDSPGGAVQYKHYQSIAKELDDGVLMEVHL